jgi:hypothetical protein
MKKIALLATAAVAAVLPAAAFAQATGGGSGPDYSALTGAVDFTSTSTMILSVGALIVGLALVVMGIRKVIAFIK